MMPAVVIDETVSCTNPVLQFMHQVGGVMADVVELKFKVTVVKGGAERVPETVVNLDLCDDGGAKLGTGRYAAGFQPTVAGSWAAGTHEILWTYKTDLAGPDFIWSQRFEVLEAGLVAAGRGYVGYADSVDLAANSAFEGFKVKDIQRAVMEVSRQIQDLTGRFFDPTFVSTKYNGTNAGALPLGDPIIGLSKLSFVGGGPADEVLDIALDHLRIYNRHLEGLLNPDDRDNPRIEFSTDLLPGRILAQGRFQLGRQNILVEGVFGYTEPDGSPIGTVPARLKKAAGILALRTLQDPFGVDVFTSNPGRIRSAQTRDQKIVFGGVNDGGVGNLTGDRIVDDILTTYLRPPHYGAVASGGQARSRSVPETF
jgi:hypothetical protein